MVAAIGIAVVVCTYIKTCTHKEQSEEKIQNIMEIHLDEIEIKLIEIFVATNQKDSF